MSILNKPKQMVLKIAGTVSPACADNLRSLAHQPEENASLHRRLDQLQGEVTDLRATVDTLNRDLDESRRLNLRAAELMDLAFSELSK